MSAKDYSTHMAMVAFVHNRSSSNNSEKFLAAKKFISVLSVNSGSRISQGKFPECVSESFCPSNSSLQVLLPANYGRQHQPSPNGKPSPGMTSRDLVPEHISFSLTVIQVE